MSNVIKVLFVEDVRTDAELEARELRRAGMAVEHRLVETEHQFLTTVAEFTPDIILSDFSMPQFDGMAALALARETCPLIPFIFVSGTLGEEYAIRALQQGAADYVLKTNLIRLPAAVTRAVREARDRAARRAVELELEAARQRLNSIFESLDDAVWSWSVPDQRVTYIGPAAKKIFGRRPDEFSSDADLWRQVIYDADRDAVLEAWRGLLGGSGTFDVEYRIVRTDGEIRWINDRARLIRDADDVPERVDGIMRDITERMAERKRINRLTRIRALSSAVNSAIVRLRQREQLLEEICRIAIEVGRFRAARVVTASANSPAPMMELIAAKGGDIEEFTGLLNAYNFAPGSSGNVLADSLNSGHPAFAIQPEPGRARGIDDSTLATASLPFVVKDEIVGALVLDAPEKDFFDPEEIGLLKELAGNISFALELIANQERIDYLAYYDVLTGLSNRTLFHDRLAQAVIASGRENSMLALVIFNLVRLRAVNESFGERAGDLVLRQVAERLKRLAHDPARVARLGGDLFAVMIPGVRDPAHVSQLLGERQFRIFDEPFLYEGQELAVSARAGVALFPNDGNSADSLLHNAESALNQARLSGEQLLFYSADVNARVAERLALESRLRRAVERQEFELYFQPKFDLHSRHTVGLEALLRWNDPDNGLIPPVQFIHLLEETGLILEVGRWAMHEAVALRRRWREEKLPAPRIAVNISAIQLKHKNFVAEVEEALRGAGSDIGLDLEITESMLMENVSEGVEKLRAIRDMGVQIAIDDFGTGYSSLAYISRLPVNALKIDRSFIQGMTEDPDKTSIVSTIISLGHALRLEVVAEGVETEQQSQLLRLLRCDQIQGYLISRPISAANMEMRLRTEA
jgi:diguanylate cyclase (GGDEF)-like protein/PAS domain S-box-containing protein